MPLRFLVGVLLAKLMFSLAWSLQAKHPASSSGLIQPAADLHGEEEVLATQR